MPRTPLWGRMVYVEATMGRTNIVIDDDLIERAMTLTGVSTKREVVDIALRRLVERREAYRAIREMKGTAAWNGDLDAWRRGRS